MATNRVWVVRFIAGNPALYSTVRTCPGSPYKRSGALSVANGIADNGGGWRVWVEHAVSEERIFESAAEVSHRKASAASPAGGE